MSPLALTHQKLGCLILDISPRGVLAAIQTFSRNMRTIHCRSLIQILLILAVGLVSIGVLDVLSAEVEQNQSIEWTSPMTEDLLVQRSLTPLNASASSGLPVTFRVIEGPGKIGAVSNQMYSPKFFYVIEATNSGSITVIAEQSGGIIGDNNYMPTMVRRTFNKTLASEKFQSYDWIWTDVPQFSVLYSYINQLSVDSNRAYLGFRSGGLWACDVSDSAVESTNSIVAHYRVSRYRESVNDVTVSGNFVFVAIGKLGIAAVDVSNPLQPKSLGEYGVGGDAVCLQVERDLAYVGLRDNGIRIIDVSKPYAPSLKGGITNGVRSVKLQIDGKLAYVAVGLTNASGELRGGLQIYDVSIPSAPVQLGFISTKGPVTALKVIDNKAYLVDLVDGLQVIDVSNPLSPTGVGGWKMSGCQDVAIVGGVACLACGDAGLFMLDVSNLDEIKLKTRMQWMEYLVFQEWTLFQVNAVNIVGNRIYINNTRQTAVIQLSENEPQRLDIALPSSVELAVSTLKPNVVSSSGLPVKVTVKSGPAVMDGDLLVLTDLGSVILQFSQAGDLKYAPISEERTLLISTSKQKQTVSWAIPDPTAILLPLRPYPLQAVSSSGLPVTFRVRSGPAYIANGSLFVTGSGSISVMAEQSGDNRFEPGISEQGWTGSNLMVATNHPASRLGGIARKILINGVLAFLTVGDNRIAMVDIGDSTNPRVLGSVKLTDNKIIDFKVDEGLVYVVLEDGVKIFSIESLEYAAAVGEYKCSGVQSIQVKGSIAYLGCREGRQGTVEIVDFSNLKQPSVKGVFDAGTPVYLVDVVGDKVCAVCGGGPNSVWSSSLYLIDVSNPVAPHKVASLGLDFFMDWERGSLCVSGNKIFVGGVENMNGGKAVHQINVIDNSRLVGDKVFRYGSSNGYGSSFNDGLQVVGNLMYSAHKDGVVVEDLRPPDYGDFFRLKTLGNPTDLKVVDNLIYVADGNGGLQIIFSPSPPILSYPEFIKSDRVRLSVQGDMSSKVFIESSVDLRNWVVESYHTPSEMPEIMMATQADTRYFRAAKVPSGFVWIQPGSFLMGSPPEEQERGHDELQHEVTLTQGFWMAEHEVTVSEFASVMMPTPRANESSKWVTWNEAVNYCKELTKRHRRDGKITNQQTYRLPTEAEWEYCARAGTTGPRYAETNRFGLRWKDLGYNTRRAATAGDINPWGLHNMLTNLPEWCSDRYSDYPASSQTDPTGPDSGVSRVIRGPGDKSASWDLGDPRTYRSAERWRDGGEPAGFRIVLSSER